jgi:hypothetical protein
MADLGPVAWPPEPIRTERLVLREPEARDRAAFIELLASPEVGTYLGGPRPRDELEREMPREPGRRPGLFVVDLDGAMIGQIILSRATGHGPPAAAGEAELGYLFLPEAWGFGYAADAPRGEAGVHRGRAVRSLRRRAVVRHVVPGHATRLSSCSPRIARPPRRGTLLDRLARPRPLLPGADPLCPFLGLPERCQRLVEVTGLGVGAAKVVV